MDIFYGKKKSIIITAMLTGLFCTSMMIFPDTALYSARKSINLWLTDILPALLPFFICANFLQNIGAVKLLKPGIFPFAMSVLSGYPMGAKIIGDLKRNNDISLHEAMRLMSFCSTSGPAFIIGAVGAGMLGSGRIGMMIACAHYLGAIINGTVYRKLLPAKEERCISFMPFEQIGIQEAFTNAIPASLKSLGTILAYIVMFMLLTDVLETTGLLWAIDSEWAKAMLKGLIEMTVGCEAIAVCPSLSECVRCIACSFMISWGGLSVMGQTMSMLTGTGVPMKYIFVTKLTHGIFSAAAAFVITYFML